MGATTHGTSKGKRRSPRGRSVRSAGRRSGGSWALAGFEYQVDVTIWLGLHLMLERSLCDRLHLEPPSDQDIAVELTHRGQGTVTTTIGIGPERLEVQVKGRSTGPWKNKEFAAILKGTRRGRSSKAGASPFVALRDDPQARYLFVTNEAVETGLRDHVVEEPQLAATAQRPPPHLRRGLSPSQLESLGPRIGICSGVNDEILKGRIDRALARHGHVPASSLSGCVLNLREAVRERMMRGECWTREQLVETIQRSGGSVRPSRLMDSYVEPRCFADIKERLAERHVVILTGPSGTGKTMTGDILQADLQLGEIPYRIVGAEAGPGIVADALQHPDPVLFHLRDPWGSVEPEPNAKAWGSELPKLLLSAGPSKKFVITSRSDVLASVGVDLQHRLAPFVVAIQPSDYDSERLGEIYDLQIRPISGARRRVAESWRSPALARLKRPYELACFVHRLATAELARLSNPEVLIAESEIEAIARVLADQVLSSGDEAARSAIVLWALLSARPQLALSVLQTVEGELWCGDPLLRLNLSSFVDRLVTAQQLRCEGGVLSVVHPKVMEGLLIILRRRDTEARFCFTQLAGAIVRACGTKHEWTAETLLELARALRNAGIHGWKPDADTGSLLHQHLVQKVRDADGAGAMRRALEDLAEFGLATLPPTQLAHHLGFRQDVQREWHSVTVAPLDTDQLAVFRAEPSTDFIVRGFVRRALPQLDAFYAPGVAGVLKELVPDLGADFLDCLRTMLSYGNPYNIECAVEGCALLGIGFDKVVDVLAAQEAKFTTWLDGYSDLLKSAEEHELDAVSADHVYEEPGERYGPISDAWKAATAWYREVHGLEALIAQPRFGEMRPHAAEMLGVSEKAVAFEELEAMLKACPGEGRASVWKAIKKHWDDRLFPAVALEMSRTDLGDDLRGTLVEIVNERCAPTRGGFVACLASLAKDYSIQRKWQMLMDVQRASRFDGETVFDPAGARGRAEALAATFPAFARQVGMAVLAVAREEIPPEGCLNSEMIAELAAWLDEEMVGVEPLVVDVAARFGVDVIRFVNALLLDDDAFRASHAVTAVALSGNRGTSELDVMWRAVCHRRFQVRRLALRWLVEDAEDPTVRMKLCDLALADSSAEIGREFADEMCRERWQEAVPALIRLMQHTRNFNSSPPYLRGANWSDFRVARTALDALAGYAYLPADAWRSLLSLAGQHDHGDPFVVAKAIEIVGPSDLPAVEDCLVAGLHAPGPVSAPHSRPIAHAAARAFVHRVGEGRQISDRALPLLLDCACDAEPSVASLLIMAIAASGEENARALLRALHGQGLFQREELAMVVVGIECKSAGHEATQLEGAIRQHGQSVKSGAAPHEFLRTWAASLANQNDVQGATSWLVESVLKLPVTRPAESPFEFRTAARPSVLTLRSLSPAAEQE